MDDTTPGVAFLLTQLGTASATRFAERLAELGLRPPHVGLLRWIGSRTGTSQQAIAEQFGMQPSRVVTFVDELEELELAQRGTDPRDRRVRTVTLTERGEQVLDEVYAVIAEHERAFTEGLSTREADQLLRLLRGLADRTGLTPGVHPGYRWHPQSGAN